MVVTTIFVRLLGFLLLGLLGGYSVAHIKEDIEDKWVDSREIEFVTGRKVLGEIPWLSGKESLSREFIHNSSSVLGASFANIVINIANKSYIDEAQVLSFVSTIPPKENATIIPNIAANLAKCGKSVLLIDTDLTSPGKLFRNNNSFQSSMKKDIVDIINEINRHLRLSKKIDNVTIHEIIKNSVLKILPSKENEFDNGFFYMCSNKRVTNIYDYIATRGFKVLVDHFKS